MARRPEKTPPGRPRLKLEISIALTVKIILLALLWFVVFRPDPARPKPDRADLFINPAVATLPADERRLDEVAERGRAVMPFDLERTTHVFTKTPTGGAQEVVAKDAADQAQIRLIRAHLGQIAEGFARGDFAGPERIHGAAMPGLEALKRAGKAISYRYRELPNGAAIDYTASDPALVEGIHRYFDAQLGDHARHAIPGHEHHRMHGQ